MEKHTVFLGSSSTSKWFAHEIVGRLGTEVTMVPWFDPESFPSGTATLEALIEKIAGCDFAVLLLADDDLQQMGTQPVHRATRDNVLFELGLCYGLLGRDHVFFFFSNLAEFKIPSDLAGIAGYPISFDQSVVKYDKGPIIAVCSQIRTRIHQVADRDVTRLQQARPRLVLKARFPQDHEAIEDDHNHLAARRFSDLIISARIDDPEIDDLYVYFEPRRLKLNHSAWTLRKDARGVYYWWPSKSIPHGMEGRISFEVVEPRAGQYKLSVVALAKKQPRYEKAFVIKVDEPSL
jgi:hypothetical protein